jgi:hypothetical protein
MATLTDVTAQPTSGYEHIDALLGRLPGWNWLAPSRTELRYTFSLAAADPNLTTSQLTGAVSAFNAAQQAAVAAALAHVTALTGIVFVATADGSAADLHFRAGNLVEADNSGLTNTRQSYSIGGSEVTSLTADAWIYLDNVEFAASNDNPAAGTVGYEVLLHEIGHAMGLKHPFDGSVTLPGSLDNTSYTLMSYTHVGGPYAAFRPLDEAALLFLYGDDGLGGDLGWSSEARYLMGTDAGETLAGGDGDDVLEGGAGNDVLQGGDGEDTAVYTGALAAYTVSTVTGGVRIAGPDGTDTLTNVERARFSDFTIPISGGTGNNPPTGTLTITGTLRQGNSLDVTSTVADVDGLGPLTLRWQQLNGSSWVDIPGAVGSSYAPQQEQVGHRLRVVATYTDGSGHAESIAGSASSDPVANVNDAPTGALTVAGDLRQGQTVTASSTVADRDGLGAFNHQWSLYDATQGWQPIAGATSASLVLTEALVGRTVRVVVDYVDGYGRAETVASAASAAIANVNDAPTGSVTITGISREDQPLSAGAALADLDGLGVISWRWQAGTDGSTWADIAGATTAGFTPGDDQVGLRLRAVASYTDGHGTAEQVASAATAAVANVNDPAAGSFTLVGTAEQGQSLAALAVLKDGDGLGTFSYEWQSSPDDITWTTIPGATENRFLLGSAQVGQHVRAVVRYVDGQGTAESLTSSPSIATVLGVVNGTTGNDTLAGSAHADRLTGDAGNDRLTGSGGNDLLIGGPGVDTAVYAGVRSGYLVAPQGATVTASAGIEGRDELQGVERLAFSDGALALDLPGNAGTVAKFLGAVFGRESVANPAYVGIGLSLLDGGMSADALMAYALEVRLGGGYSREAEVQLLYQNLAGVAPSAVDVAYWTGTLASGQYTPVSLAVFAAEYELNLQNIGFTGLVQDGLPYTPAG